MKVKRQYVERHIGSNDAEQQHMLETIGVDSLDTLVKQTVPENIRLHRSLNIPNPVDEYDYLQQIKSIAQQNKVYRTFIGMGFYNTITPSVILRNIFENPGWYTQYTPYQSEISQGRLEALLNFQTMVCDLTGMELSNASLLDEASAASEAMSMLHRLGSRERKDASTFLVSHNVFQTTIDVLQTRADPLGIKLVIGDPHQFTFDESVFGVLLQYPGEDGEITDYSDVVKTAHDNNVLVAVAADLLSLVLLSPPGQWGADVVVGSTQRFGVPLGFGGPHAAYFATRDDFKRHVPGRIIGVSMDRHGNTGYRMALQTREQHIRREKATSNICTAQSLLAIMAGMYAVYHGPDGLYDIAHRVHTYTRLLEDGLQRLGIKSCFQKYFDTLKIEASLQTINSAVQEAKRRGINLRLIDETHIGISLDETTTHNDVETLIDGFAAALDQSTPEISPLETLEEIIPDSLKRTTPFLQHDVFNRYHSETQMMRYIKSLEQKDLSLTASMIPLGSCTMKLNPTTAMLPVSLPEFASIHPFAPADQTKGYLQIIKELEQFLSEITGFAATSLQPNSGAQGEFTGLMVIRAYHHSRGEKQRRVVFIPTSAHGTNPASAIMAGSKVILIKCNDQGDIDIEDIKKKAKEYETDLSALMVTYPSTHGVFEENIVEVCEIIHKHGGLVYMDGANMNAQVGLTQPSLIGADVCHLNLHKTFSIPHGGGGPGVGPICAASHLAPFLPGHSVRNTGGEQAITAVAGTPWGSAGILLISHAYIRLLGAKGMTEVSRQAILKANYIKERLTPYFPVVYTGANGHVAHEIILDMRSFKKETGIEVEDIAKRLIDYGFHAPTVSWPVPGTMMVEPTESEPLEELDRFCDAMIQIYHEIQEIKNNADRQDNVLINAPHTAAEAISDSWTHPYSREKAIYPLDSVKSHKFWPPVARIDNTYGDRNLMCTCAPMDDYAQM